jgi:hypothetical protein
MIGNIRILSDEEIKKLSEFEGMTPSTVTMNTQLELFSKEDFSDTYLNSGAADAVSTIDLSGLDFTIGNFSTNSPFSDSWNHISLNDIFISGNPTDRSMSVTGNVNVKDGDININGISLSDRLNKMEERLGILRPNPELEKDFEKLKKLGERYRKLEKKLSEQIKTFNILKEDNSDV